MQDENNTCETLSRGECSDCYTVSYCNMPSKGLTCNTTGLVWRLFYQRNLQARQEIRQKRFPASSWTDWWFIGGTGRDISGRSSERISDLSVHLLSHRRTVACNCLTSHTAWRCYFSTAPRSSSHIEQCNTAQLVSTPHSRI